MEEMQYYLMIGGTILLGLLATIIYYLARYSFKSHEKDPEVLPSLNRKELSENTQSSTQSQEILTQLKKDTESLKEPVALVPVEKKDLKDALANTKRNFFGRIKESFVGKSTLSDDDMEVLEELLYTSDMGPVTVQRLMSAVGEKLQASERKQLSVVQEALKSEVQEIFNSVHPTRFKDLAETFDLKESYEQTQVWLIVGVNGAGKTTSIGKLANLMAQKGLKVLVAAGDTFRAAAGEQLEAWTERAQVEIFSPAGVKDPSAVAFDACQKGIAGKFDVVIIDTAGRLHTQDNLMEELKKMKRVIQKLDSTAPHQTLIVLDANSGQNALLQAKNFNNILDLTGAILTKLDGTAKGGVAIGLACELSLPIRAIGVGEKIEDLRAFDSVEFVNSII